MTSPDSSVASALVFNPDAVMTKLAGGDWGGVWDHIQTFLENLTVTLKGDLNRKLQESMADDSTRTYVEGMGALAGELIRAFLNDPATRIPDKNFHGLMFCHETMHTLFALFGHADTDADVEAMLSGGKDLGDLEQKKILLLLSMKTHLDIVSILKKTESKYRVPALSVYLGYSKIFESAVHENKCKLYALRGELEKAASEFSTLSSALVAYFKCSYLDFADKHLLKENINTAVRRHLDNLSREIKRIKAMPKLNPVPKGGDSKPHLVLILEEFRKGHAMNRSWAGWIRSLESEFTVTMLLHEPKCDPSLKEDFKNLITFTNLGQLIELCHHLDPRIVFLPSVGMTFFGIVAANMRLAPLQMMALGHPATSMSDKIDFVYGQSVLYDERAFPKDRFLADDAAFNFIPVFTKEQVLGNGVRHRQKGDTSPLRVTIVGTVQKLAAPFLELLSDIEADSPYPIHFLFMTDCTGLDSLYMPRALAERFKNFTFFGWQNYADYLESLKKSDIVLNPFPFGHTNTVIDTLLCGKPCVGLEGIEPASKTEAVVLDKVGLRDMFAVKDKAEYKARFRHYADKIMAGETEFFDRAVVYDRLYEEGKQTDFGKTLKWVYERRKEVLSTPRKCVTAFHLPE